MKGDEQTTCVSLEYSACFFYHAADMQICISAVADMQICSPSVLPLFVQIWKIICDIAKKSQMSIHLSLRKLSNA